MNLSRHTKVTLGLAYADGNAVREGAEIDMQGWDGVLIILSTATHAANCVGDLHAEQDIVTGMAGAVDLIGTAIVTGENDDDKIIVLDIYRPLERFVRGVVTKDTSNNQAESMLYIQYRGRKLPVTDMGADSYELHVSPAEGTK